MKKTMYVVGCISVFLILTGFMFKTQSWPGANMMMVVGGVLINLGVLPMFLAQKLRKSN